MNSWMPSLQFTPILKITKTLTHRIKKEPVQQFICKNIKKNNNNNNRHIMHVKTVEENKLGYAVHEFCHFKIEGNSFYNMGINIKYMVTNFPCLQSFSFTNHKR